ncbi:arylalkylamine N-acetyltransferase 1-like [Bicyclus anynana]|uniref:Arylalkylamine N-acetyltransferase 1-like n=1 Tax=Bicyclus anynana TaxID=110368 RepID=A0ABM3LJ35_BICAN|nr:arylalkylamine N-acetyltransferase 1-like [Bicyclus anynana]
MVYSRPSSLPVPTVWHRFTARGVTLRVQDLTQQQVEPAVRLLLQHFTADEPPCKYIEINKHPGAVAELEKLWRNTIKDQLSLVCVEDVDEPKEIVGVNVLTVCSRSDEEEEFKTENRIWAKLFGAVELVGKSVDIFARFGVQRYLTAYGLVVAPPWRGCGIGGEILRARIPLCKALGIKVTATVFTAAASQAVAKKAGFHDLFQISYEELAQRGFRFPGVEENTKYSKLMALEII